MGPNRAVSKGDRGRELVCFAYLIGYFTWRNTIGNISGHGVRTAYGRLCGAEVVRADIGLDRGSEAVEANAGVANGRPAAVGAWWPPAGDVCGSQGRGRRPQWCASS